MSDKPTHTNLDEIDFDDLHARLAERVKEVAAAAKQADVENTVDVDVNYDDSGLTSITVTPDEDWTQEGERGMDRFHAVLGAGGAVKSATMSSVLCDDKEFARHNWGGSANRMWNTGILGRIERMA